MIYTTEELAARIIPVVRRYGIKAVWIFGSYARGNASEDSDVDILIDTDGSTLTGLFSLGILYSELEEVLGKAIDLITLNALQQETHMKSEDSFRKTVWKEKVSLYDAA